MRTAILSLLSALFGFVSTGETQETKRVNKGLVVLYDFTATEGTLVPDRAGAGKPLNLRINYPNGARSSREGVEIINKTKILGVALPTKLFAAVKRSGEITLEAWIKPSNLKQSGPARIVSLSKDSTHRNLTLGQDKDKFEVRLRTTVTSDNGIPSISTKAKVATTRLTHLVYTRQRNGTASIYVNGQLEQRDKVGGTLSNWDTSYKLCLGDELSGGRSWKGIYRLVAIYHRGLTNDEVAQNYAAGPGVTASSTQVEERADFFAKSIAPMLVEHCLECHDASTKLGGLDLSHKAMAFAGGDSGKVIEPGKPDESYLWETVLNNEMPQDRSPLSAEQKQLIKEWIEEGASWSMDFVDPALFAHGGRESERFVQRLTIEEYIASVKAAVGVDIAHEARELLPADRRADGFSNTSYNLSVDFKHVEAFARLAEIAVEKMEIGEFAKRFSKTRKFTDKDMGTLIENMGSWILRGSLDEDEVIALRGISTTVASSGGSYEDAVGLIIEAMLQSPRFLYRVENQVGDGTLWPVGEYELAARMSYILWGAPPDQELFRTAESGELFDPQERDRQIARMLDDPRSLARAKQFISEWLNLDGLDNLQPNADRFPAWDPALVGDMRNETLKFFEHVAWIEDRPLSDLLSAETTFVTPRLARHYRLLSQAKEIEEHGGSQQIDLTNDPVRGGLLTQGSVLTIGGDEASMVTRGLFVLHNLLRGVVKDPPPCVNTMPIPTEPGVTQRVIATARIQNEACGGCHIKFEPLAFGLEKFDGLGTYHAKDEHGNELRDDGQVLFPGTADPIEYSTTKELMKLLSASPRVQESLTWKVTQFALGRPLTAADAPYIDKIHQAAQQQGGTYRNLIAAIVKSDLVQLSSTELVEP